MLRLRFDEACFARARMSCSVSRTGKGAADGTAGVSSDIGGSLLAGLVDLAAQRFPDVRVELAEGLGEPQLLDLPRPLQGNLEDVLHGGGAGRQHDDLVRQG